MKKTVSGLILPIVLLMGLFFPVTAGDFLAVTGPCYLRFPEDHGPHPGFRTEWWYYTGNVTDEDGRDCGFQLTFFRHSLTPLQDRKNWPDPASTWRTDTLYLAHAALTDINGKRHLQAEKVSRPVLSMAGAERSGLSVSLQVHDWQATLQPEGHRLRADAGGFSLALDLLPEKPPVLHGEAGYSRKGGAPERASCYYSFTRMRVEGALSVDGKRHSVKGLAWMDHEFSTAPLEPGVTGWDWFSLQLREHSEVMIYLLREKAGGVHGASGGTFVSAEGKIRHLARDDVQVEPVDFWNSPRSGARYPVKWLVKVWPLNLEVTVAARFLDQEMRTQASTGVDYWEGAVSVRGTRAGRPVEGAGYVELTGYAKPFDAPM